MKRHYFPPMKIDDNRLPHTIELHRSGSVYYRVYGGTTLMRGETLYHKKTGFLSVFIPGYQIVIKRYNQKEKRFEIDVKKMGKEDD